MVTVENYVDTLNICVATNGFVLTLFPVYTSMRKSLRSQFKCSLYISMGIIFILYITLTVSAITYFGKDQLQASLIDDFSTQTDIVSKIILAIFLLVIMTNIPFAFFAGKIALIAMLNILITLKQDLTDDRSYQPFREETTSESEEAMSHFTSGARSMVSMVSREE